MAHLVSSRYCQKVCRTFQTSVTESHPGLILLTHPIKQASRRHGELAGYVALASDREILFRRASVAGWKNASAGSPVIAVVRREITRQHTEEFFLTTYQLQLRAEKSLNDRVSVYVGLYVHTLSRILLNRATSVTERGFIIS